MTEHQRKIVRPLAEQNMNISATARALNCHRNSLLYRIKNIQKKTGLDPMNFYDLHELYQIAVSEEN